MKRATTFSSSQAYRLMNAGKRPMTKNELADYKAENPKGRAKLTTSMDTPDGTMQTYVKEKFRETMLCRSINSDSNARSLVWGKIMERYVFENKLDLSYRHMNSQERLVHYEIDCWTGVPDTLRNKERVGDVKCPWTLTSFCDTIEAMWSAETLAQEKPEHYWQLVSNSCLVPCDKAELIVYVPKASELPKIKEFVENFEGDDDLTPFQVEWISHEIGSYLDAGKKPSFPYLPDASRYNDFNRMEFDVPKASQELLKQRVLMAEKLLKEKLKDNG